ncbi:MAG: helix-turn-helix domain-containing protein [Candidatus Woesearchaeota archaeon]
MRKIILKEDVLNKLKQSFDLNLYEVRLWTALLSRGMATAGELSEVGDVPRSRAYDILSSLEKKGFIELKPTKPLMYAAVEPEKVVENAKKVTKKKAASAIKSLDNLSGTELLKELEGVYSEGAGSLEGSEMTGAIKGRKNLYSHMRTMLNSAKKSVCMMSSPLGITRKAEAFSDELETLKKNGVKIRIATQVSKDSSAALRKLSKVAEIRHAKGISSRFCVVDNKELMFMLTDDADVHQNYDSAVWIGTPFFVNAMSQVFETAWKKFEPADAHLKKLP